MVDHTVQNAHLLEFSIRWNLPRIIAGKENEWLKLLALREWVQTTLNPHGWDQIPENDDAVCILEAAALGKRFNCWSYSTVMIEAALALGWSARRLSLGIDPAWKRPGNSGHTVAEIWVDLWRKWVVMDADLNAHYEVDGIPAGGLEIHDCWLRHELNRICCVRGKHIPAFCRPADGNLYTPEQQAASAVFSAYDAVDYYVQLTAGGTSRRPAMHWLNDPDTSCPYQNGMFCNGILYTNDPNIFNERAEK